MMTTMRRRSPTAGFTLIEVLVALVILSVMAATAFKGMDSISKAREVSEGKLKRTLRLQSVMTQWDADIASVIDVPTLGPLQGPRPFLFNGSYLRFARQVPGGVQVVAWSLRDGRWQRWAGPPVTTVGELDTQWTQADQLKGTEPGTLTMLKGALQWQVFFCAGVTSQQCTWGNAQSASGTNTLPIAVRSILTLGPDSGFAGAADRSTFLPPH